MRVLVYVSGRSDCTLLLPSIRALKARCDVSVVLGTDQQPEVMRTLLGEGVTPSMVCELGDRIDLFRDTYIGVGSLLDGVDYMLCYGDRSETLAAACAASTAGVLIAHIEGGDITLGGLQDDRARGAITALSTLHFPTTQESADVLERHGVSRTQIEVCGLPSLSLRGDDLEAPEKHVLPLILLCLQPMPGHVQNQTSAALSAFWNCNDIGPLRVIAFAPCRDPGHETITSELAGACGPLVSYPPAKFLGLLRAIGRGDIVGCMLGNSSAGLKEAPAFGVPVVNIGDRQKGRLRSVHVLDVEHKADAIAAGLRVALSPAFRELCRISPSPYRGLPDSGEIVANRIAKEIACNRTTAKT